MSNPNHKPSSRSNNPVYIFDDIKFEIEITISEAYRLKSEFEINLLNMFEGNNLDHLATNLTLNDELAIELWWDTIKSKYTSEDRIKCIDKLSRESLDNFKEAYWAAIVNFSPRAGKDTLLDLKKHLPELLRRSAASQMKDLIQQSENSTSTS